MIASARPAPAGATILMVDDEVANLDLLEAFLEPERLGRLLRTTDPRTLTALVEECRPDLLILDLHMPYCSGFDILAGLRGRGARGDFLPVLVLTADSTSEAKQRALAGGAHDFLTKPLEAVEVVLRVRNLLETRRLFVDARRAAGARDRVLSVVAHDLRNPLAAIAADAEMLEALLPPDAPPRQRSAISRIRRVADRTERQLQDLLDVARLEQDGLPVDPRPVAVAALVEQAGELLEPLARAHGVALAFEGPADAPPVVADAGRVVQVLSNVVGNALRITPEGGRVEVSWLVEAEELAFTIADTGPGIAPEHLPHLFAPFWQADPEQRRGAGLGLVIARALVQAHGGRIWVDSTPGAGAAFHFTLPLAAQPATSGGRGR